MKRKFPGVNMSRSTLFKMQKNLLNYSYKRVT